MFSKLKNAVGKGNDTKDELSIQIEKDKKELVEFEKKIKKVQERFEKEAKFAKDQYEETKKTLKICSEVNGQEDNAFLKCHEIITKTDEYAKKYEDKINEKVIKQMKQYVEACTTLQKRVKILDDRKKNMDKANTKYNDMLKKPEAKQVGLSDLKQNYLNSRDSWEYLRDEMSVDIRKTLTNMQTSFDGLCRSFMKNYAKYMLNTQKVWDELKDYSKNLEKKDLELDEIMTKTDESMVSEQNVNERRQKEIADGTYKA